MRTRILFFALGFASVYFVKYIVVGLVTWNGFFHPGRSEGKDATIFAFPFFGIFHHSTPMGNIAKGTA